MTVERTETQIKVVDANDDSTWKYSLDLDIPAFGNRTFRYVTWRKEQGAPPAPGSTFLGVLEPWRRSSYYIKRGNITEGEVDGSEAPWQVDWNLVEIREPLDIPEEGGASPTQPNRIGPPPDGSLRGEETAGKALPTVFLDANLRFRVEQEGVNDRKAITDALAMVEPGMWAVDGLLTEAATIAEWYNTRLMARLQGGLVGAAQEAGAVVTDVTPDTPGELPQVKNKAEVIDYAKTKGWKREAIQGVLKHAGYSSSAEYLREHSAQDLLVLLASGVDAGWLADQLAGEGSW